MYIYRGKYTELYSSICIIFIFPLQCVLNGNSMYNMKVLMDTKLHVHVHIMQELNVSQPLLYTIYA